jgi:hypothetical protein
MEPEARAREVRSLAYASGFQIFTGARSASKGRVLPLLARNLYQKIAVRMVSVSAVLDPNVGSTGTA